MYVHRNYQRIILTSCVLAERTVPIETSEIFKLQILQIPESYIPLIKLALGFQYTQRKYKRNHIRNLPKLAGGLVGDNFLVGETLNSRFSFCGRCRVYYFVGTSALGLFPNISMVAISPEFLSSSSPDKL